MGVIWARYRTSLMIQKRVFATWIIFFDTAMLGSLQTHESQCAFGLPNHFRSGLLLVKPGSSSCNSVFVPMKIFFSFLLLWRKANANQISRLLATASGKKIKSIAYLSSTSDICNFTAAPRNSREVLRLSQTEKHSDFSQAFPKSEKKVMPLMSFACKIL